MEGIICRCCFEDEQRILNSEWEFFLPLGMEALWLILSFFAETRGCSVFDHGCAVWPASVVSNAEVLPSNDRSEFEATVKHLMVRKRC